MKKALITGSSSGIGFEYAKYLNLKGWSLDLVSHNEGVKKKKRVFQDNNNSYHLLDLSKDSIAELLVK